MSDSTKVSFETLHRILLQYGLELYIPRQVKTQPICYRIETMEHKYMLYIDLDISIRERAIPMDGYRLQVNSAGEEVNKTLGDGCIWYSLLYQKTKSKSG